LAKYYDGLKEMVECQDVNAANEMLKNGLVLLAIKEKAGVLGNIIVYVLGRFN
jgi:hypothetical protein